MHNVQYSIFNIELISEISQNIVAVNQDGRERERPMLEILSKCSVRENVSITRLRIYWRLRVLP